MASKNKYIAHVATRPMVRAAALQMIALLKPGVAVAEEPWCAWWLKASTPVAYDFLDFDFDLLVPLLLSGGTMVLASLDSMAACLLPVLLLVPDTRPEFLSSGSAFSFDFAGFVDGAASLTLVGSGFSGCNVGAGGVGFDGVGFDGVGFDGVGFDGVGFDGVGLAAGTVVVVSVVTFSSVPFGLASVPAASFGVTEDRCRERADVCTPNRALLP